MEGERDNKLCLGVWMSLQMMMVAGGSCRAVSAGEVGQEEAIQLN